MDGDPMFAYPPVACVASCYDCRLTSTCGADEVHCCGGPARNCDGGDSCWSGCTDQGETGPLTGVTARNSCCGRYWPGSGHGDVGSGPRNALKTDGGCVACS